MKAKTKPFWHQPFKLLSGIKTETVPKMTRVFREDGSDPFKEWWIGGVELEEI